MEKSYDESLAILMSEARDLFKNANFAESARKYLEAAKNQEATRGIAQAEDLYHEAIKNFIRASEENKEKKQYRISAQNLYYVSFVFKKLGATEDFMAATKAVVDDLTNAAEEYIKVWNEYDRGITLASTACFFLFLIDDFQAAENLYMEYIAQIQDDPGFTRAQQILYSSGHAIKAVKDSDTASLLNAQQLVGSHLKPSLSQIMGELFFPAIDEAMEAVVKTFRSKVKLPRIVPELKVSRDLVFGQPTDVNIIIENEGEGEASNVQFRLNIPDEIEVLEGAKEIIMETLPANHTTEQKIVINCLSTTSEATHEISANITFYDQLQTKQTMMIGPYALIFREKSIIKEYEVELAELAEKGLELKNNLKSNEIYPEEATNLIMNFTTNLIKESEQLLSNEEFETAQANIKSIEGIHNILEQILGEEFLEQVHAKREEIIKERIEEQILIASENLKQELDEQKAIEIENLKQTIEEELVETQKALEEDKQAEQQELIAKLEEEHNKNLQEAIDEVRAEKDKELSELSEKLDEEKKKALQDQETLLRDEFQKLLSEQQGRKRR